VEAAPNIGVPGWRAPAHAGAPKACRHTPPRSHRHGCRRERVKPRCVYKLVEDGGLTFSGLDQVESEEDHRRRHGLEFP